jgi:hypothetical protein
MAVPRCNDRPQYESIMFCIILLEQPLVRFLNVCHFAVVSFSCISSCSSFSKNQSNIVRHLLSQRLNCSCSMATSKPSTQLRIPCNKWGANGFDRPYAFPEIVRLAKEFRNAVIFPGKD